ncbi:MAG: NAD(P)-binding protein [Gammaproteobacteria bacterium]|nr:NAD(P)-binding protein [Gammaproteobacteria bacterium]MYB39510.1 NAD(P)-binding protein [Gammaproteobacteria bacterium]
MRVAVIGGGVAGMATAHVAQRFADVTLFEASGSLGGHTDTHNLFVDGRTYAVDSGFIVFNRRNYPGFSAWLDELGVDSRPTSMSFGVSVDGVEYGTTDLRALFCQRRNLLSSTFLAMLRDIRRFHQAARCVGHDDTRTLAEFLAEEGFSESFEQRHLLPMCAAIWSVPPERARQTPIGHVAQFMANHGLLQLRDRPQWEVVEGGSAAYVRAFASRFRGCVRASQPVRRVERDAEGATVQTDVGRDRFEHVVLACHADQALELIAPTPLEREVVGAFRYQPNRAVVHSDASAMPQRRGAWSSWNVCAGRAGGMEFTYWMNRLQGIHSPHPFFVTLNPERQLQAVWAERHYSHPVFSRRTQAAQRRRAEVQGANRTFWCGAWWGWGFHEDGFQSGVEAAHAVAAAAGHMGALADAR